MKLKLVDYWLRGLDRKEDYFTEELSSTVFGRQLCGLVEEYRSRPDRGNQLQPRRRTGISNAAGSTGLRPDIPFSRLEELLSIVPLAEAMD